MAPLQRSDKVDLASLAGTWLGAIFTAVGLVAVYSQLRNAISDFGKHRKQLVIRSAGDWVALIPTKNMPRKGLVEEVAPAFAGWLQNAYIRDKNIPVSLPSATNAGTSSWSILFALCGIRAMDQMTYGGPKSRMHTPHDVNIATGLPPRQADLIFRDGHVAYGFSMNEFAALLILCGFRISAFSATRPTIISGPFGTMSVVDEGPFSQVARFDPHNIWGSLLHTQDLPVARCLDYAVGLVQTPERGNHQILIPNYGKRFKLSQYHYWNGTPQSDHLAILKNALEQLTSISQPHVLRYNELTEVDVAYERSIALHLNLTYSEAKNVPASLRHAITIGHAISSLKPWGLLPVLSQHFVWAYQPLISPYVKPGLETLLDLQDRLRYSKSVSSKGWDNIVAQADALPRIGNISKNYFSKSTDSCRQYFTAMKKLFNSLNIEFENVRRTLAAKVVSDNWRDTRTPQEKGLQEMNDETNSSSDLPQLGEGFVQAFGPLLGEQETPFVMVEDWALEIYATFLWGWLGDAVPLEDDALDFGQRFKRRVFLM
nr:hypothetical protein [uncultured organism]